MSVETRMRQGNGDYFEVMPCLYPKKIGNGKDDRSSFTETGGAVY